MSEQRMSFEQEGAPRTPHRPGIGEEEDASSSIASSLSVLMRNLSVSPEKSSNSPSTSVEQHTTRRYSVIHVQMTYAVSTEVTNLTAPTPTRASLDGNAKSTKPSETEKKETVIPVVIVAHPKTQRAIPADIQRFVERLNHAKNVIVMVGAGLSVAAGIPDFRTPGTGLYSQLAKYKLPRPEAVFEISYFMRNPEPFRKLASELWPGRKYLPTVGHYFVKLLHDKGRLLRCYTQNIDSLETMTGLPQEKIVAAHGNFDSATCVITKKKVTNIDEVRDAYLNNTHAELNKKYGTKLVKPDIVFFGESLPARFHRLAPMDFHDADLLIVMGTSLQVHPFASLVTMTKPGTPRMLINRERVGENLGMRFNKDVFFKGDCDDGCLLLAEALGWDTELRDISKPKL